MKIQPILDQIQQSLTTTENGALAFEEFGGDLNANIMLFSRDLRYPPKTEFIKLLLAAHQESRQTFLKNIANIIDIRGGKGEREAARTIVGLLAIIEPEFFINNFSTIANLSRWDVIFDNIDNFNQEQIDAITQYVFENQDNLLIWKWMPSINSSAKSIYLANKWKKAFNLNAKDYRKLLSSKRQELNLIETSLAQKQTQNIEIAKLPKKAFLKYQAALEKYQPEQLTKYYEDLKTGKKTADLSVLNPVDLVRFFDRSEKPDQADILWTQLEDFIKTDFSFFPVIDVSGSMEGTPSDVANGLGIYAAEKNKSSFKNKVMIFSDKNKVLDLSSKTSFSQKLSAIRSNSDIANTNLEAVFETFFNLASLVPTSVRKEAIPSSILLISDGQFDSMVNYSNKTTILRTFQQKFAAAEIPFPQIIYWNVNGRSNIPANKDDVGFLMISGYSPRILSMFSEDLKNFSMEQFLLKALEKYENIFSDKENSSKKTKGTSYV